MEHQTLQADGDLARRLGLAVLIVGFSGLVAQMLLLRELLIVYAGNEFSIGIVLANWLVLEAFGCWCPGRKAENVRHKIETFVLITLFFVLAMPFAVYLARISRHILGFSIGEGMGLWTILYSSLIVLLPVSVAHGALFTFGCRISADAFGRDAASAGRVYIYETLGTICGGIAWTYYLIEYLHAFQMTAALAVINALACLGLLAPRWKTGAFQKLLLLAASLVAVLGLYALVSGTATRMHNLAVKAQWKGHNVVHYQNSVYGNICVVEREGQYTYFKDGVPGISTPVPDMAFVEEFVHLPLLAHPRPEKLLILSGGAGGVIHEISKHPSVRLVEYVELDPLLLELLAKYSTPLTADELSWDNLEIRHVDGRLFLRTTMTEYDVILVGLTGPVDLQSNRFFTREFFDIAHARLKPDGILLSIAPGSLAYLNEELKNLNAAIYHTLKSVFAHVRVIPGDDRNYFLASDSNEIEMMDTSRLVRRMTQRELTADTMVPWHIENKLHPRWADWFAGFIENSAPRINRDFKPVAVFLSAAHWSALFTPYLRGAFRLFERIGPLSIGALTLLLAAVYTAFMRTARFRGTGVTFCVTTTGFAGMIFDLAMILLFQSIYGYVFSWIGLLVTSFMAGAAGGAIIMTSILPRLNNDLKMFMKIDLAIAGFSLALPLFFGALQSRLDHQSVYVLLKAMFMIMLFLGGLLTGAQFPLANKIHLDKCANISSAAGRLYGADLMGGWLGGIAGGVVLIPLLGFYQTCLLVALLKLSGFAIMMSGRLGKERKEPCRQEL